MHKTNSTEKEKVKNLLLAAARKFGVTLTTEQIERGVSQISATQYAEEQDLWDACKEFFL